MAAAEAVATAAAEQPTEPTPWMLIRVLSEIKAGRIPPWQKVTNAKSETSMANDPWMEFVVKYVTELS